MTNQRLPARVYWVRRALALVVVGVLGTGIVLGVRAFLGWAVPALRGPYASGVQPTATSPGGVDSCDPGLLRLAIVPAAQTFPAGVSPSFNLTIDNIGTDACLVEADDAHRQIVVMSGSDRIWSNQDCGPADGDRTLLLAAGESDTRQFAWNLNRSAQGCPADLPSPAPGTYLVSFTVGGAQVAQATFTLDPPEPEPATAQTEAGPDDAEPAAGADG
ncbi:MAG: hypothetical protein FWH11_11270 [Micrococcales bacterium]|nr:hypothetical protein [Micrococcales bacterium]